ncbi:MAG: PKD domain-containing protein, partial [Chloroflexi bacterium]|nr:PKD domain-containing protein [Chloroflexota bacterium]
MYRHSRLVTKAIHLLVVISILSTSAPMPMSTTVHAAQPASIDVAKPVRNISSPAFLPTTYRSMPSHVSDPLPRPYLAESVRVAPEVTVQELDNEQTLAQDTDGHPAVISVIVEPAQLPADGKTEALVLIYVTDAEGRPVADGTRVIVEATSGQLSAGEGYTDEGLVRMTLTADRQSQRGEGRLVARVGDLSGETTFIIGRPGRVRIGRENKDVTPDAAAVVQRVRNRLRPTTRGEWAVANRRYDATFGAAGLNLTLKEDDEQERGLLKEVDGGRFSFRLVMIRVGEETLYRNRGRPTTPSVTGNGAHYQRTPTIEESYRALNNSMQQLFTLQEPLENAGNLVIRGFLDTRLRPELVSSEEGILFHLPGAARESGGVLRYSGAVVQDARGQTIYADLALQGRRLTLTVPGEWLAEAEYPVVIDPMIGDPNLISDPRDTQGELDVAYNPDDGEYLVVWGGYDTGGASTDLEGQRVQADGTPVGDLIVISQADNDQLKPAVTYNPDQGEYLVVWTDYRNDIDGDVYGQRVAGDGSLLGDNFAIGATEALQDTPDVAYNPNDGVYLAVWRDRRGEVIYIYGQVISSDGALSGANFAVYDGGGDNYNPRVAYNGQTGEFLVVWSRWGSNIYGQYLSGSGALLDNTGTPENESGSNVAFIVSDDGSSQNYLAVAADDVDGDYLVVWRDKRNDSRGDIYGQVISATGAISGTDFVVAATASVYQDYPDLAYDAVNDIHLVVWRDRRNGGSDIYAQAIVPTGALSGTNVAVYEGSYTQYCPEVAANTTAGGYLAVWRDGRNSTYNVYGRRVSGNGQVYGDSFPVGPVTGNKQYPSAAFNDADDEYLLVWEDYRNGDVDVYGQRLNEAGEPVGGNVRVSTEAATGDQIQPKVAAASAIGYLVVWEDRHSDSLGDIYGQLISSDGVLSGSNFAIAATSDEQDYPNLAYNPDDDLYLVVWIDERDDPYGDVYGQLISSGGILSGNNFIVSAHGGHRTQDRPSVIYNEQSGEFLVVWHQWTSSGNNDIYGQRLSGQGELLDNTDTAADESTEYVSFAITTDGTAQVYPAIAAEEANGNCLVVWMDQRSYDTNNYDVYGQIVSSGGALLGTNVALAVADEYQRIPVVAAMPGETGFMVTWNDKRSGYDLYGQRVSTTGTLIDTNELLVDEVGWLSGLAMTAHTDLPQVLLTWEQSYDLYAQRYSVLMADFEAAPRLGSAPLTVAFTDLSLPAGEIETYEWDFGDGITSTEASPSHTYTQPGLTTAGGAYTVTLTVSGTNGSNTLLRPAYVTVNASFTPETDLRGYWRLDEKTGIRYDLSGNDNHLASVGSVGWAESGYIGSAADMEKDDDEYLVIDDALQSGLAITGSLTLMGWAKPESDSDSMMLAAKYRWYKGEAEEAGYRVGLRSGGLLQMIVSPDGTFQSSYQLLGTTALEVGTWYHVAAVFDIQAREMRLYLDGDLEASSPVNFDYLYPSNAPFMLGANWNDQGQVAQYFDGQLDEWRVYARALSQSEIETVMGLPGASFVGASTQGFAPLVVTYTNTSTNTTTYAWDFGDGSPPSTEENPVHTYTQPGVYTVTLDASDGTLTDTLVRPAYVQTTALDQGLQGHWRLDEESGTRYDNSSHSNNLTDHNTVGSTMGQVGLA